MSTTEAGPSAAELSALANKGVSFASPNDVSSGQPDAIHSLNGGVIWQGGENTACDGLSYTDSRCRGTGSGTATQDASGKALDSITMPFIVLPNPASTTGKSLAAKGVTTGLAVAAVYKDKVAYGVVGDTSDAEEVGDMSYRMEELLGLVPNGGGIQSGVTFIIFTGACATMADAGSASEAKERGVLLAQSLVDKNP